MRVAIPVGEDGGIEITQTLPEAEAEHWPERDESELDMSTAVAELEAKFKAVTLRSDWRERVKGSVDRILANRYRYSTIQEHTKIPWWVIGILHMRESTFSFAGWLANGDPLTGPTVRVPIGLRCPGNPPWEWDQAAIVSLNHHRAGRTFSFRTIGDCLDYIERYNGLGYRTGAGRNTEPPSSSPYLWSGTTGYDRGKYIADGTFSRTAVDMQVGAAAVMLEMIARGLSIVETVRPPIEDSQVTWWELFRSDSSNIILGYKGSDPILRIETNLIQELGETFRLHPTARTFRVAPAGKAVPEIEPVKPQPTPQPTPPAQRVEPFIRITKRQNSPNEHGLVPLIAEFFGPDGKRYGSVPCISGLSGHQFFRTGPNSRAGSKEPLPQGRWSVGNIAFVNGRDNYSGSFGEGLGPVWVPVTPLFQTSRSAIGFHRDDGVKGTLGCIGLPTTADLRELVRLLRVHDPKIMLVEWGV